MFLQGVTSLPPEMLGPAKASFISTITPLLRDLDAKIAAAAAAPDHPIWITGSDQLTYVDFFAYEQFDYVRLLLTGESQLRLAEVCPKIMEFCARFEALDGIKEYLKSDRYSKYPLYGERSYLGRNGPEN